MKLTIYRKLLLSYLALALLTVLASAYAIFSLNQITEIAHRIIQNDVTVVDISKKMMAALIAQESAEKRFLILRDTALQDIFLIRSREFKEGLGRFRTRRFSGYDDVLARISILHGQYEVLFSQEVDFIRQNRFDEAHAVSENQGRKAIDEMALNIRNLQKQAERKIDESMNEISAQGLQASRVTVLLTLVSLGVALIVVMLVTYNISRPLRKLEKATALIAEGKFDHDLRLNRHDEIGSLAQAFGAMARRLKVLEERNLDASPLTGLPGNLAIERQISKRLAAKKTFSLCHLDLDNFKPFADQYGYAWASEVIKDVARMLLDGVKALGTVEDFIGHIGGDDYVLISAPLRAETICREIVSAFDKGIRKFYSEQDRKQGYFIGKDRKGEEQKFPLITLTISIVTDDGTRFRSPLEMAQAAAVLKAYAKTLPGSNYVKEGEMPRG